MSFRPAAVGALVALLFTVSPLFGNGGTVRISRAPLGPYFVTVFSSPTPLRTGDVDISVLVQDSADAAVEVPLFVEARRVGSGGEGGADDGAESESNGEAAASLRRAATREQATNKLFRAAKFEVPTPGSWEFTVRVGPPSEPIGTVSFTDTLTEATLLDRPYLLALLILLPLGVAGWFLLGRDDDRESR